MGLFRKLLFGASAALAGAALAVATGGNSYAAPSTPANLPQATSANNPDLLTIWPCPVSCSTGGPLESIPWTTVKAQMALALGATYLTATNNLSDIPTPATARANLGLGTAATQNTGTSGANLPFLNGANTWSGSQTFSNPISTPAPTTGGSGLNIGQGSADPTSPVNGDVWNNNGLKIRISGTTYALLGTGDVHLGVVNNLSDLANAATARTNLGLGGSATENVGTGAGTVAAGNDSRFAGPTQNSQSASYGLVLSDAGGQVYHPAADTTARTWTIPANASVAYAIGTKIELVNDCSAGAITLAITSDTLEWFPAGTTGTRTLAACGQATLTKLGATEWSLVGVGLSYLDWGNLPEALRPANDNGVADDDVAYG